MTNSTNRSDRKAKASRTNGARSRGPTSAEGKEKASQNSRKHGLTGKVMPTEADADIVSELITRLLERYDANDPEQAALIERAVMATLRLKRARTLLTEAIEDIAAPDNASRINGRRMIGTILGKIRTDLQKFYGGKPPSLSLVRHAAERAGYIPKRSSLSRGAPTKLMAYAKRFRGERDRALAQLEAAYKANQKSLATSAERPQ